MIPQACVYLRIYRALRVKQLRNIFTATDKRKWYRKKRNVSHFIMPQILKLVSAIFYEIFIFHQMIDL